MCNQHILVLRRVLGNDQVDKVLLNHVSCWVQIHNLPIDFHSSKIVQNIGEYVGTFLESDSADFNCVRVSIDIQKPLKRRMRIKKPDRWIFDTRGLRCSVSFTVS